MREAEILESLTGGVVFGRKPAEGRGRMIAIRMVDKKVKKMLIATQWL